MNSTRTLKAKTGPVGQSAPPAVPFGPRIFGILNITADSFSDGGRYLDPEAALAHAAALVRDGAAVIDIGAASSHPDAAAIDPQVEIGRLQPVVAALQAQGIAVSIDSFSPPVQLWALEQGVPFLNDIDGFAEPALYPALAASSARLVVMHSVQRRGKATRVHVPPDGIVEAVCHFFAERIAALEAAGIARSRLILDPGMGFFLGSDAEASFAMLRAIPRVKAAFGLPVLISVSRKSFLRALAGRAPLESGALSLAAEVEAARLGADFIRTHDARALSDGLKVMQRVGGR